MRTEPSPHAPRRVMLLLPLMLAVPVTLLAQVAQQPVDEPYDESVSAQIPATIPESARSMPNPFPPTEESLARGSRLFASQCTMCHGARGAGDGGLAGSLRIKVPDFRDRSKRTDGELFYILTEGHGRMPAEGERLSPEWRWDMINYVRSFSN